MQNAGTGHSNGNGNDTSQGDGGNMNVNGGGIGGGSSGNVGSSGSHGYGVALSGHGVEVMALDLQRFSTWERCLVASYLEPLRLALRAMLREYRASAHLAIEREMAAVAHKSDKAAQPLLKLRSVC